MEERAGVIPYTEVPRSMIEADFLSANEFRVCAVLHSLNFLKHIFPSQEELEKMTGLARKTLYSAIDHLEGMGIIVKFDQRTTRSGRFSTNEYKFACGSWDKWYQSRYGAYKVATLKGTKITAGDIPQDGEAKIEVYENKLPYVRIYNQFLYSPNLNSNEIRVFLYLKQFANCREIYPSYNTLCKKTSLSKPTVIKTISSLSDNTLLMNIMQTHEYCGMGSNRYLIANDEELKQWLNLAA